MLTEVCVEQHLNRLYLRLCTRSTTDDHLVCELKPHDEVLAADRLKLFRTSVLTVPRGRTSGASKGSMMWDVQRSRQLDSLALNSADTIHSISRVDD